MREAITTGIIDTLFGARNVSFISGNALEIDSLSARAEAKHYTEEDCADGGLAHANPSEDEDARDQTLRNEDGERAEGVGEVVGDQPAEERGGVEDREGVQSDV